MNWIMAQRWNSLLFAHWPVDHALLRARVPMALDLEQFDGTAWLSITPFLLSGMRPAGLGELPAFPPFPEMNLRTYVSFEGRRGIFFFSLDAGSRMAVEGARLFYHLPYFNARMQVTRAADGTTVYRSDRMDGRAPPGAFHATYRPHGPAAPAAPASLDHWLVERYSLYAMSASGQLYRADVRHRPWELQGAELTVERNTLGATCGVTFDGPPARLSYSAQLDVEATWPVRLAPAQR